MSLRRNKEPVDCTLAIITACLMIIIFSMIAYFVTNHKYFLWVLAGSSVLLVLTIAISAVNLAVKSIRKRK